MNSALRTVLFVALISCMIILCFSSTAYAIGNLRTPIVPVELNSTFSSAITGAVSGVIYDMKEKPVSNARVTIYSVAKISGKNVNKEVLLVENNPQYTTRDGKFSFNNIPKGTYNITVEKNDNVASTIVNVNDGLVMSNLFIFNYTHDNIEPTSTPTDAPTATAAPTVTPEQVIEKSDSGAARILLVLFLSVQFALSIVILLMYSLNRL